MIIIYIKFDKENNSKNNQSLLLLLCFFFLIFYNFPLHYYKDILKINELLYISEIEIPYSLLAQQFMSERADLVASSKGL